MERAKCDHDFRQTTLRRYFENDDGPDFDGIDLHRIGTWYAVKMGDHYGRLRLRDKRPWGEYFFSF